jgi:hypothetical protein
MPGLGICPVIGVLGATCLEVVILERKAKDRKRGIAKGSNRMPAGSTFFDKLVPIIIIALTVLMVMVILAAAGILLGIVPV